MRRSGTPLSEADLADWATYAREVVPLPGRARPAPPAGTPGSEEAPAPASPRGLARRRPRPAAPLAIGEQPPGVDNATWSRFRSGRLPSARTIDLHGHTVQGAFLALSAAVHAAHASRLRCIEVVTGRGSGEAGGVIRRELPHWLNLPELRPLVLAAAHPHRANPGATRLLLRRARERAP
ncbi:MAG: Smr/MutS family protein [Alphaproteobacteria bacterium]|nr:Smr/MutS family protein [Alphaproteobacteria bacterium]